MTGWLAAHRRRLGTRTGRRALTCRGQTLLVLRWFRDRTDVAALAWDAGISVSTGYRYLHEGIDVLAARAPDLPGLLAERRAAGPGYLLLDGTLIPTSSVPRPHRAEHRRLVLRQARPARQHRPAAHRPD